MEGGSLREVRYPNHTCRGEGKNVGKNVSLECSFVIGSEMRLKQMRQNPFQHLSSFRHDQMFKKLGKQVIFEHVKSVCI